MRAFVLAAVLAVSSISFAMLPEGTFEGKGVWKTPDNSEGTWTEEAIITKKEDAFNVASHITVYFKEEKIQEESSSTDFVPTQNGFFEMKHGGRNSGGGYCFGPTCHFNFTDHDGTGEETIHMAAGMLHKMGSMDGSQEGVSFRVAWAGTLKAKH